MNGIDRNYLIDEDYEVSLRRKEATPRRCTDILCSIVLLLFLILLAVVMGIQFGDGNPDSLLNGWDESGHTCGVDYPDYPYFYYVIAVDSSTTPEQQQEHLREKIEKMVSDGTIDPADVIKYHDWIQKVKNGEAVSIRTIPPELRDKYGKYFTPADAGYSIRQACIKKCPVEEDDPVEC